MNSPYHSPPWMSSVLRAAAVYNWVWSVLGVLFPSSLWTVVGLPAPNYPCLMQTLGILVGVFGVGYWIAARDPVTHAELVGVGLLGKLLAPWTIVGAVATGSLPLGTLAAVLLNDVLWWFPLGLILLHAAHVRSESAVSSPVESLAEELQRTRTASGLSLWELSFQQPILVVFIRHLGCTFCREALDDLRRHSERIMSSGVVPVVVHLATDEEVQPLLDRFQLKGVQVISDPDRRLFRAFQLPLGRWWQLFGPRVLWRAVIEGVVFRYGFGKIVGNPLQLTGAFLVYRGEIVRSFRARTSADRADLSELACNLPGSVSIS